MHPIARARARPPWLTHFVPAEVHTKGGRAMARIKYNDSDEEEMCVRCIVGGKRECEACKKDAVER